ncbi:PfkB family carbohydrate kinase [Mycobacterium sp. 3519A]|uniref:PfkB family carbohydrate kinase n=1 Tax=Mycobacterium sp. 3519A TaxID=2057184 RepID=UPI001F2A308B|nr:PfkB family carbohydrate kinase [Mycobacterium sp. 3519A]
MAVEAYGRWPRPGGDRGRSGRCQDPAASLAVLRAAGVAAVGAQLGARGALLADRIVAAPRVRAVDPTGAGDTFCGALAGRLARGASLGQAVKTACAIAAESVRRVGATALVGSTL